MLVHIQLAQCVRSCCAVDLLSSGAGMTDMLHASSLLVLVLPYRRS